jgi:predicted deacylase
LIGVMGQLGLIKEKPIRKPAKVFPFPWLYSEHNGLFYPQVCIGENVSAGQTVGTVCDYFGRSCRRLSRLPTGCPFWSLLSH